MANVTQETAPVRVTKVHATSFWGELFDRDFWITGLAILKYVPRSFRVKRVDGMVFFTEAKYVEFRNRVLGVTSENARQWGTMSVSQMLHHLNLACGGPFGFYSLPDESYLVARTFFRWILIDWFSEQPVGLRRPKDFRIPHDEQFDFEFEKQQLLKILEVAYNARSASDCGPHPMFGRMTLKEWGKLLQIHIDYHLRQFAA